MRWFALAAGLATVPEFDSGGRRAMHCALDRSHLPTLAGKARFLMGLAAHARTTFRPAIELT